MDEQFTFALEDINSIFGISADTLRAIAHGHGVPVEQVVVRALTLYARAEIPDLDLDSPALSPEQVQALADRRTAADEKTDSPSLSSRSQLAELSRRLSGEHAAVNESLDAAIGDGLDALKEKWMR